MLLPLQGATLPTNITQGDALGLGLLGFGFPFGRRFLIQSELNHQTSVARFQEFIIGYMEMLKVDDAKLDFWNRL